MARLGRQGLDHHPDVKTNVADGRRQVGAMVGQNAAGVAVKDKDGIDLQGVVAQLRAWCRSASARLEAMISLKSTATASSRPCRALITPWV